MIDNYNPLPFYRSLEEQNHRKTYAFGVIYPLFSPRDRLLPFQVRRKHLANPSLSVILVSMEDGTTTDITAASGVQSITGTDYDYLICNAASPWNIAPAIGRYYVRLADGTNQWYSEVFTIVDNLSSYIRVEWKNVYDQPLGNGSAILYEGTQYRNVLYFASQLGKPEYSFDEEGENRDGWYFAEKQVSTKTFKFVINAPEYLCDCMRLIRLADFVRVRDQYGNYHDADTFLVTPQWQEQGDIAEVVCEFTTGTIVKHIGTGYVGNGDFNDDFNDDFNN